MRSVHKHTLALIIIFMKKIATYSSESKMDERNTALMFAPNLFRMHSMDPLTEYGQTEKKVDLCLFLMTYTEEIFGKDVVGALKRRLTKEQKLQIAIKPINVERKQRRAGK